MKPLLPLPLSLLLSLSLPTSISANDLLKDHPSLSSSSTFTPKDLIELPRPAAAIPAPGDDSKVGVSLVGEYSFKEKRNTKSLYLASLHPHPSKSKSNLNTKHHHPPKPLLLLSSTPTTSLSSPLWLDPTTLAYLNSTGGSEQLWTVDIGVHADGLWSELELSADGVMEEEKDSAIDYLKPKQNLTPTHLHTFPPSTSPTSLKFLPLPDPKQQLAGRETTSIKSGLLAFSAHVYRDLPIEETEKGEKRWDGRGDEGWVWDELYIREWDTWRNPEKVHQIFVTLLDLPTSSAHLRSKASIPHSAYLAPFNSSSTFSLMQPLASDEYDLAVSPASAASASSSNKGDGSGLKVNLAVAIKDKYMNYAFHTRKQVYLAEIPLDTEFGIKSLDGSYPVGYIAHTLPRNSQTSTTGEVRMLTPGTQGAVGGLRFSPDGKRLAWLEMREDGNESDRNRVVTFAVGRGTGREGREEWTESWDRSPSEIIWAKDSSSLYFLAQDQGSILPYHLTHPGHLPTPLLFEGSTNSLNQLNNETLLLGINTLTYPTEDFILSFHSTKESRSNSGDGDKTPTSTLHPLTSWSSKSLSSKNLAAGEKFWFKGASGDDVMGWIVKPKGWSKGDGRGKWPMAFLIHGGPEGAWEDNWSTRWNPNVFAQQGYFTVFINFHGSTGYGQDFTESIHSPKSDWGGKPYRDLVAGLQYVLDEHPEIDRERLAALGASYGGYMINWLQGHNDLTKFKVFVCHDGVFDLFGMYYSTEQVYFSEKEGGSVTPWEDKAAYESFSPANHVGKWNTPMLVIQGGTDFRIPEAQSIGAFTALQRRGIPSRFLYFPKENHWVLNPQNSLRWHTEVFKWIDEFVGEKSKTAPFVVQE